MATNVAEAREALTRLLAVFVDRYHLTKPYDSAAVAAIEAAIEAGADADLAGLRAMLAGYNLYAHHEALAVAALTDAEEALTDRRSVPEMPPMKPLTRQNKDELLALAASRDVEVPEGATVAKLREALASVGFEEDPESVVEPEPEVIEARGTTFTFPGQATNAIDAAAEEEPEPETEVEALEWGADADDAQEGNSQ